jgi:hypothetical protein
MQNPGQLSVQINTRQDKATAQWPCQNNYILELDGKLTSRIQDNQQQDKGKLS